jgi:hypothetical protein
MRQLRFSVSILLLRVSALDCGHMYGTHKGISGCSVFQTRQNEVVSDLFTTEDNDFVQHYVT